MEKVKIYHNPNCGTSRNTLALIREKGIEPEIILYLQTPPTKEELIQLIKAMNIQVRDLLRQNVDPYHQLNLSDPKWSDLELINWMTVHPILINRPIVVTSLGTRLCRPFDKVSEILP